MSGSIRCHHYNVSYLATEVKLPESQLQDDSGAGPKPINAIFHLSMSFKESGLSRLVHAGSWQKANELVAKENTMSRSLGHKTTKRFLWKVQVEGHQNQTTL